MAAELGVGDWPKSEQVWDELARRSALRSVSVPRDGRPWSSHWRCRQRLVEFDPSR